MREKFVTILSLFAVYSIIAVAFIPTLILVLICRIFGVEDIGSDPHSGDRYHGKK